jgi:hypothetical protein
MGRGDFSGILTAIVGMMLDPAAGCNFDARVEVHNELLDLPRESLDDVVLKVVNGSRSRQIHSNMTLDGLLPNGLVSKC